MKKDAALTERLYSTPKTPRKITKAIKRTNCGGLACEAALSLSFSFSCFLSLSQFLILRAIKSVA